MRKSFFTFLFIWLLLSASFPPAQAAASPANAYQRANSFFASGKFNEAIAEYRKLLISLPKGVRAGDLHTRIADSYFRLEAYGRALNSYRKAIDLQEESERPATQYWIGFSCFLLGRDSEAVAEFLKIPERYPRSGMWVGTAYYWAGRASERMGKADQAASFYRKAGGNGKSTQGRFAKEKADQANRSSTKSQALNHK